ncbi:MAG: tetratricopeptide repeat protein [Kiritimatiellae bacterium]|jgi:tetratricopeptide (TPR) repeat protein|nr:tetratricopeptide repeat protein [Kiritimatiellia bacterium]MDD2347743.1 tetratricopeptide repeat protein [Kiritimatiellia bacterium]MDD3582616.1 tetratricopeptide repeat protein [Kiritimatiellia bacterium]HHU13634.1 tetratricopeptide repeat protein [Lentisphaerota bacterium]HON46941.1 tetratricopeptide repeat protein [Kiritimatiellia bacterium]
MIRIQITCLCAVCVLLASGCGSDSGQSALRRGMAAFGEKNYPEAITHLTLASQRITDSPDLYYHLGCAHLLKGELDPAAAAFKAAFDLDPKHGETLAGLGQLAYYTKELPKAQIFFRQALEAETTSDESRASILTGLALTEAALRRNDQARLCLLRAQQTDRRYAPAFYNLGALYLNVYSLREEALDQFELFVRLTDASDPYQEKARNQITRLRAALNRAKAEELDRVRRDPDLAARRLHEGIDAQCARQFTKAIRCYREALNADPLAFNAAFGLGKLYRDQKQPAEALEAFKRAAAINPVHQDSLLQAAVLAVQLRRYDEAERILDLAIARSPFTPESADLMARIRHAQGRYAEARAYGQFYLSLLRPDAEGRDAYEKWVNALPK